jgi:hypothetical protein
VRAHAERRFSGGWPVGGCSLQCGHIDQFWRGPVPGSESAAPPDVALSAGMPSSGQFLRGSHGSAIGLDFG